MLKFVTILSFSILACACTNRISITASEDRCFVNSPLPYGNVSITTAVAQEDCEAIKVKKSAPSASAPK